MSNEIVIEKFYEKLEDFKQECPHCGGTLQFIQLGDDGSWECENNDSPDESNYFESNNITKCHGEGCSNLILGSKYTYFSETYQKEITDYFTHLEDQYCQIPHRDDTTCLGIAQSESDQMEQEDYKIREQMKGHPSNCDCFLCIHY